METPAPDTTPVRFHESSPVDLQLRRLQRGSHAKSCNCTPTLSFSLALAMDPPAEFLSDLCHLLAFLAVFLLLSIVAVLKAVVIGPIVFIIILIGNLTIVLALYPCHIVWTCYCVLRTKKFGVGLKVLMLLLAPVPAQLWPYAAVVGTVLTGLVSGVGMPLMATFEEAGEGVRDRLVRCLTAGTWSSIKRACTIVRDFKDICFHSYFSIMDGLLEARGEDVMDIRLSQIPGCILAGVLGVLIDVPMFSLIVVYKVPVMLYKGWRQLIRDLIGRSGPFLESVCVPFAGLLILLWPVAVVLTAAAGVLSSLCVGCYAAAVAYQEYSTKSGILYVISVISIFDEYTNDFLYMREGSCFPRPRYRVAVLPHSPSITAKHFPEQSNAPLTQPLLRMGSVKMQELKAVVILENFFHACEFHGKDLVQAGAIWVSDLEAWQNSKNKIVNIGLPSYVFLQCYIRSIKCGSTGFLMRDNVEVTSVNRPEGRVFDWLFEPMLLMKEQIRAADLGETEEAYLYKLALYCGDVQRLTAWQNGGLPPADVVKRAQLDGLCRRLQGFTLTISRMPTFRRRFEEVVKVLLQEARHRLRPSFDGASIEQTE